ncbi:MAG: ABC transporter [Spirochaetes bacterium GWD1_27_9]|nr:MAG: ABC transporter [Spirochaetes bacterium GWB1_27_13]OHD28318.1 MAG: ABC transporter [Spirochaetes bacterium GWC1_27_15]OHD29206.1 MAG: ABC transporter [Spirochaetes bacterium GWD1_27_9]
MEIIYSIMNFLLPFEWAKYSFMKNALLAIIIVTPTLGVLSTLIVNNKMAFFSDAIGHSALTGIAVGILIGLKLPIVSMVIYALFLAILIIIIKNKTKNFTDTIIGVFSSISLSLGVVILSKGGNFSKYTNYLIGDLLSITPKEIIMVVIIFILVLAFWGIFFNKLLVVSINPSLAKSRGISVLFLEIIFASLIAIIVIFSIQWIGILIINSLLILPAAAARNISKNVKSYHIFSVIFSFVSGIIGLILSYYIGTATGATIVLVIGVIYFISLIFKN